MFEKLVQWPRRILVCGACIVMLMAVQGCDDDNNVSSPDEDNSEEVITTVNLTFDPIGSGAQVTAQFRDADGPGGNAPTQTAITLANGVSYTLTLELLNETVPSSDEEYRIIDEIKEEAEEHQFFFTGTSIGGLVSHSYADNESNYTANEVGDDLPVGIRSQVDATSTGSGSFIVTLKHQPPVNGVPVKTSSSGIGDGETDIEVNFDLVVQ